MQVLHPCLNPRLQEAVEPLSPTAGRAASESLDEPLLPDYNGRAGANPFERISHRIQVGYRERIALMPVKGDSGCATGIVRGRARRRLAVLM